MAKSSSRTTGAGAGRSGAGPLANPTSASTVPATVEITAPTATAAIVQAVQESQVFVEGPYRVKLPKDKRRLSIDVAEAALNERGYSTIRGSERWNPTLKQMERDIRFPDGSVKRLTGKEELDILYPKKPKPPR
ncbi:hypothetical protein EB077_13555 [bacterium]|nr:hypothetical protein [bacterium]